jgi:hypothetical protein
MTAFPRDGRNGWRLPLDTRKPARRYALRAFDTFPGRETEDERNWTRPQLQPRAGRQQYDHLPVLFKSVLIAFWSGLRLRLPFLYSRAETLAFSFYAFLKTLLIWLPGAGTVVLAGLGDGLQVFRTD